MPLQSLARSKGRGRRGLMIDRLESRTLYSASAPTLVGYFPDYEDSSATLNTLVTSKFEGLTQVNYFSIVPTPTGLLPGTTVNGVSNASTTTGDGYTLPGAKSQLNVLVADAHAAGVKVVVTIGGGGSETNNLTSVVESNSAEWATFASSITQFAATYKIDGVDFDWEPASLNGTDVANYGNMIAAVRSANPGMILSSAVNSEKLQVSTGGTAYVLNATGMSNLTYVNVMAYDLLPGNVSPIGQAESDLTGWGNFAVANGISKTKLIFGMPFYGTSGTTWANTVADQYSQLITSYGSLPNPSADSVVISGTTWNYNGPVTIASKVAYALDGGYGGALAWEIGQDYFSGGAYNATYSLLPQFAVAEAASTGTIKGTVLTAGGAPVAGETLYLDTNGNGTLETGEPTAVTSASGAYSFSTLLIGSYTVREVLPTGDTQTSPAGSAGVAANATAGGTSTANFTVAPPLVNTALAMVNNGSTNVSNATQAVSFTATLTGAVPSGETITLEDASNGNAVVATGTLANGSATLTLPAGALLAGTHSLFAVYGGDSTFAASQSAVAAQIVQVVVTGVVVNGNNAALAGVQRSMVNSIVYTFSEPVNAGAGAFSIAVHGGQTGTVPTLAWSAVSPATDGSSTQWAVTFSGAGIVGGSIADGVYDITMQAAAVASDANPAVVADARTADTFDRLFGDINGDGTVNNADYARFTRAFGTSTGATAYVAAFDYDGNGSINNLDYAQFSRRFGKSFTF